MYCSHHKSSMSSNQNHGLSQPLPFVHHPIHPTPKPTSLIPPPTSMAMKTPTSITNNTPSSLSVPNAHIDYRGCGKQPPTTQPHQQSSRENRARSVLLGMVVGVATHEKSMYVCVRAYASGLAATSTKYTREIVAHFVTAFCKEMRSCQRCSSLLLLIDIVALRCYPPAHGQSHQQQHCQEE